MVRFHEISSWWERESFFFFKLMKIQQNKADFEHRMSDCHPPIAFPVIPRVTARSWLPQHSEGFQVTQFARALHRFEKNDVGGDNGNGRVGGESTRRSQKSSCPQLLGYFSRGCLQTARLPDPLWPWRVQVTKMAMALWRTLTGLGEPLTFPRTFPSPLEMFFAFSLSPDL